MNEKSFERKGINSGDFRDIRASEYLRRELKDTTAKYENDKRFKKTVEELKNLAQKQRMGLLIEKDNDAIGIGNYRIIEIINKKTSEKNLLIAEYPESEILVGEKILDNIRCLFISDEELAKKGFTEIFSHEDQHRTGLAGELRQQEKLELKKIFKEAKSYNEAHEKRTDVLLKYFYDIETAAEKQRQEKTYKDLKKDSIAFIEKEAKMRVVLDAARQGFYYLKSFKSYPKRKLMVPGLDIVEPKVRNRIRKEMDKIKQNLLKKYDEKVKNMK